MLAPLPFEKNLHVSVIQTERLEFIFKACTKKVNPFQSFFLVCCSALDWFAGDSHQGLCSIIGFFWYSLACWVLLRMHSALFKIHSGRKMHTLKMVSVPFSVGLQAVPRCLGWCSITMEHPSLNHKWRWLIIKVKTLFSCLRCKTLIRCVDSYQAPSYLSSCASCAGIPHPTPMEINGSSTRDVKVQ